MNTASAINAIKWSDNALHLLDQRLLPEKEVYLSLKTSTEVTEAIRDMVVRGAPAIGITAAYGVVLAAKNRWQESQSNWKLNIEPDLDELSNSRPTAINLNWAIAQMRSLISECDENPVEKLLMLARQIHAADIAANRHMGDLGAALIEKSSGVLTHCNTGSLATGGYGTALGVIRSAYEGNRLSHIFADETRPWLQGARLTAWELAKENIPVQLIVEGAAASLMRQGKISWVIVGADRIAGNGDVANKIGTYGLAALARYHGLKFMVVAPTSTVDLSTHSGDNIPIEVRDAKEILSVMGQAIAPQTVGAWNPVFDVTPAELIDAIVTEKGVVMAPNEQKMSALMQEG